MLTSLHIRNLALVDELIWHLEPGLLAVTGETGAGKSIIVGALKLILGERADRSLIRSGEKECVVEAFFQIENPQLIQMLNSTLEELGLPPCEEGELILKRILTTSGGNKQYVNCSAATIQALRTLGEHLVDLHGPHDHQSLLNPVRQLELLDAHARGQKLFEKYSGLYQQWKQAVRKLEETLESGMANAQEIDLLRWQIQEIESAAFTEGEDRDLDQKYHLAQHGQRLSHTIGGIVSKLRGDRHAILESLREINRLANEAERVDPTLKETFDTVRGAQSELEEAALTLTDYLFGIDTNPAEVSRLEERINTLENLKRKYGRNLEEIFAFLERAQIRLDEIENRDLAIEKLEAQVVSLRREVEEAGKALSVAREKSSPELANLISHHLKDLGFKQSQFEIKLTPVDEPMAQGLENVEFEFSPNPGEPLKPLRIIASSGEMARVMLAVKTALAELDTIPLLVFDEIDANVGGNIATAVGKKMSELGRGRQVISITHFPQVASVASSQHVVKKLTVEDRTISTIQPVEGEARVDELERMLGAGGESARALARKLLETHHS